jgi:predicted TIM-barrel fold metal-dependent hydrolase
MTASPSTHLSAISLGVPVVDSHSHVIADDPVRYPLAPMGGKQSDWSKERPVNGIGMAQAMKQAGVAKSVLVQASTCYGHDNSYTLDCVKANTSQFVGVYSVDTLQADGVAQVKRWKDAGLSGMRVFIAGHTAAADHSVRLDDPRSFPVWEYISEHNIPMCVQLRADGLPQLETLLKQFPKAKVLLDHFARPVLEEGAPYVQAASLFALAKYPNLNFKVTTHNVRESKEGKSTQAAFSKAVVSAFGANRIAWGSNFPASAGGLTKHLQEALEATASLTLEEQRWIYSGTAHALYPDLNKS